MQLVVMLYDGAIHALTEAQEHLKHDNIAKRARCTNKAAAIISELQACLNFEEGGSIAASLDRLYVYMKHQIFKANLEKRSEPLVEVVNLLNNLRSAWVELAKQAPAQSSPVPTPFPETSLPKTGTTGSASLSGLNICG
jgi:flagellar protein FliS